MKPEIAPSPMPQGTGLEKLRICDNLGGCNAGEGMVAKLTEIPDLKH